MPDSNINDLADMLEGNIPSAPVPAAEPVNPTPAAEPTPTPVNEPVTTPISDSTPATPFQAPSFDEELLRISNGSIKNGDELNAALQKAQQLADLESQVNQYKTQNEELKLKAEADPFANDYVRKYNALASGGATQDQLDAFSKVNKSGDIDKIDPVEAKVLALQLKNGVSEQEARRYVNRTYKLDPDAYTEEEIADAQLDLKIQSQADKDFLKTYKAEIEVSPASVQERQQMQAQQQYEAHLQKLEPIVNSVIQEVPNLFKGLSLNGKEGEGAIKHDFQPSAESVQNLNAYIKQFVSSQGTDLPATQEGREKIAAYAQNVLAMANYKNWMIEAASAREKQVRAEYHNPTPINRGQDNPVAVNPSKVEQDKFVLDNY
jgi:hypothetical protein